MDTPDSSPSCEFLFAVRSRRRTGTLTHNISCFCEEKRTDDVYTESGMLFKTVVQTSDQRDETEYDSYGRASVSRHVRAAGNGLFQLTEVAHGCFRVERTTVVSENGTPINLQETLWDVDRPQTQAETRFNKDGSPATTITTFLNKLGKVTRRDETVWHAASRPAITQTTEFDWTGSALQHVKTMHNMHGQPLWQEKTQYPQNSNKPSKKEVFVFNGQAKPSVVDVTEFDASAGKAHQVLDCSQQAIDCLD